MTELAWEAIAIGGALGGVVAGHLGAMWWLNRRERRRWRP